MEQTRKSAIVSRVCFSLTHPTHDWFKLHAGNYKTVYISCRTLRYCHFASLILFVDTLIAKKDKKKSGKCNVCFEANRVRILFLCTLCKYMMLVFIYFPFGIYFLRWNDKTNSICVFVRCFLRTARRYIPMCLLSKRAYSNSVFSCFYFLASLCNNLYLCYFIILFPFCPAYFNSRASLTTEMVL